MRIENVSQALAFRADNKHLQKRNNKMSENVKGDVFEKNPKKGFSDVVENFITLEENAKNMWKQDSKTIEYCINRGKKDNFEKYRNLNLLGTNKIVYGQKQKDGYPENISIFSVKAGFKRTFNYEIDDYEKGNYKVERFAEKEFDGSKTDTLYTVENNEVTYIKQTNNMDKDTIEIDLSEKGKMHILMNDKETGENHREIHIGNNGIHHLSYNDEGVKIEYYDCNLDKQKNRKKKNENQ